MKDVRTTSSRPGFLPGGLFQRGQMIEKSCDAVSYATFPGNGRKIRELNKRVRLFKGPDGWFADGNRGQLWEFGRGTLGFTAGWKKAIDSLIAAGFVPTQVGDSEANFSCPWTDENEKLLIRLLKLRPRRNPNSGTYETVR